MVNPEDLPTFGRYKILNLLGKGGTARVYRAVRSGQMGFGKEVALKVIDPEATADEEAALSLINEARLGGLLRHKNIVEIDDFEKVDDTYYIAMEFIDGWALEKVLTVLKNKKKMVPPTLVLQIMMEVCEGLHYAHDRQDRDGKSLNIIHRDLKPGNIMVSRAGEVKIADFGTAKAATNVKKTAVGFTRGTPAYMSPEQVAGEPLDRRSDIFALGAILYELVTLKMAFPGDNMFAVMRRVLDGDTEDAQAKMAEISPDLARVMGKCMAPEAEDRYQTAQEISDDLREVSRTLKPGPPIREWLTREMKDLASTKTGEFGGDFVQGLRAAAAQIKPQPPTENIDVRAQTIQPDDEFPAPEPMSQLQTGSMAPLEDDFDDVFGVSAEYSMHFDPTESSLPLPGDPELMGQFGGVKADKPPLPVAPGGRSLVSRPGALQPEPDLGGDFGGDFGDDFAALAPPLGPASMEAPLPQSGGLASDRSGPPSRPGVAPPAAPPRAPQPPPRPQPPAPSGPQGGPPGFDMDKFSLAPDSQPAAPAMRRERPPPRSRPGSQPPRTTDGSRETTRQRSKTWQASLAKRKRRDFVLQVLGLAVLAGGGYWLFGSPGGFDQRQAEVGRMISSFTGGSGGSRVSASFADIPAGEIVLGEKGEQNAGESRSAIAVPAFSIMANEVTVAQYKTGCVQRPFGLGCKGWDGGEGWQDGSHPVVKVTWEDARGFCEGQGWALPTEAQWELAARGVDRRKYPWGEKHKMKAMNYCDIGCDEAGLPHTNEDDRFPQTSPVGRFRAGRTQEGVNDLSGNVSEWAEDCWIQNHLDRADWKAATKDRCTTRAVRGGSWKETVHAQSGYRRTPAVASTRSEKIGFRCVQAAAPAPE
jgi:serine/threonine protein kinase/formylglycine-generating enzyme required for sulfatase activity